jgi:hypothetical protein
MKESSVRREGGVRKRMSNFLFLSLQEKQKPIYRTSTNGLEKSLTPFTPLGVYTRVPLVEKKQPVF